MKISNKDIFEELTDGDVLCPTTNGIVNGNTGELVMGAGNAKLFKEKCLGLALDLGRKVKVFGNVPVYSGMYEYNSKAFHVVSFPTKNHYKDPSSLSLIEKSARDLVAIADDKGFARIRICAPGVGLGGLPWQVVKDTLGKILDDRFIIHCLGNKSTSSTAQITTPKSFALIIAGSRSYNNFNDLDTLCSYLLSKKINEGYSITVISGTARGADTLGEQFASKYGYSVLRMPADWSKGKSAGYARNLEMATTAMNKYDECGCVCFRVNGSNGTSHMIDICKKNNIKHVVKDYRI